jgi:drug/metabolite transporter (DMT)-like permease
MTDDADIRRATLIGASAILLFSTLAVLAAASGPIPPFQMVAISFSVAFVSGIAATVARGRPLAAVFPRSPAIWGLGIYGLFGYHFAYFTAFKHAPPVDATLINYLWPLLIVLFSALLPDERLRWFHVGGALAGMAGCAVLVLGAERGEGGGTALGYGAAAGAALIWSSYSVMCRRVGHVPTDAVIGFCGATALLAAICHAVLETWVPPDALSWASLIGMGLGPVGLAFLTWDHGVKRGDIRVMGAMSYAAPLMSTSWMILAGFGTASPRVGVACLLIIGGALLATRDFWHRG